METTMLKPQTLESYIDVPVAPSKPQIRERRRPMFTGNEDHDISLADAAKLTRNYRERAGKNAIKGGFFGQAALQQLLDQEGVVGVRYYYGQENDDRPVLVLVGVDATGRDLVEGFLLERSIPCPPFCGFFNELNS
ncbi:MAG: hypothetical protein QHI48_06365 [Bacteroidota bacterium]|nr:hypothetical protein [Bacteroidota bacterium]